MTEAAVASAEPSAGRLDERILAALHKLPGEIAFNGLRRVLGAHPEALARSLRRLEREGLVLRSGAGYRALSAPSAPGAARGETLRVVAEVELADSVRVPELAARLTGRWFGSLRWVGVIDRPEERLLAWAPQGGAGLVLLGTRQGHLRVLVPDPAAGLEGGEAEDAAFELLVHAVEALRGPVDRAGAPPLVHGFVRAPVPGPAEN